MISVDDDTMLSTSLSASSSSSSLVIVDYDEVKEIPSSLQQPMEEIDPIVQAEDEGTYILSSQDATTRHDHDSSRKHVENLSSPSATPVKIGGPGSKLPRIVESFLAWVLALSCLSVACWYFFVVGASHEEKDKDKKKMQERTLYAVPLMTHSPRELLSVATVHGIMHRYQQLQTLLQQARFHPHASKDDNHKALVAFVRNNELARRLTSLIMVQRHRRPSLWHEFSMYLSEHTTNANKSGALLSILQSIWPKLVSLPQDRYCSSDSTTFDMSVIIPLYKENGLELLSRLSELADAADDCRSVEFIIVNAGGCTHMTKVKEVLQSADSIRKRCCVSILDYMDGGGRGPCLNYGARHGKGRFLTFLHADTRLSRHWDTAIRKTLTPDSNRLVTTFCAFSFAIDKSLIKPSNTAEKSYIPPGLNAIETTANWRCRLFQLPYGDQCLTIPRYIFEFVGGFPDQCLMEDYELVRLLRQRIRISQQTGSLMAAEEFQMLPMRAFCSPRRWQSFGVLYVTFTNSRIVQLYNSAINHDNQDSTGEEKGEDNLVFPPMSADEALFCRYYGTSMAPPRKHPEHSPWEIRLFREDRNKDKKLR